MNDVPDQVIVRGTAATLTVTHLDADGEPADASGAVTVGVVDSAGATVVAAGTTTTSAGGGVYTVALTPAQTAQLDRLTVTWSDAGDSSTFTTTVDIVGRHWCSVATLRQLRTLDDEVRFPTATVRSVRDWVCWQIEDLCAQAFVPRFATATLDGPGGPDLLLPHPRIRSVRSAATTLAGVATTIDVDDIAPDDSGWLYLPAGWPKGRGNVTVSYEHGHDRPPPDLLARATHYIREQLLDDRAGRNVLSVIDPAGITTRFAAPGGRRRPTGDLELDEVIGRYDRNRIIGGSF